MVNEHNKQTQSATESALDMFQESGLEVRSVKNGKDPWWEYAKEKPIACVYGGEHRMIHPRVCTWHKQAKDRFCTGCPRATWIVERKARQDQQSKLFIGA